MNFAYASKNTIYQKYYLKIVISLPVTVMRHRNVRTIKKFVLIGGIGQRYESAALVCVKW